MGVMKFFVIRHSKRKLLQLTKKLIALYQHHFLTKYTFDCSDEEIHLLHVDGNIKVKLALSHISPICTITDDCTIIDIVPYMENLSFNCKSVKKLESYIHVITNFLHNFNTICDQHLALSTISD